MNRKKQADKGGIRRGESGQAAVEMAITLPIVLAFVFGVLAVAAWYYAQTTAAVNAANAARAGGITRGNVAYAQGESERLLRGVLGGTASSALSGSTEVSVDPLRRAVAVRTASSTSIRIPLIGRLNFDVFGSSFTRNWQFAPGPPDPWE